MPDFSSQGRQRQVATGTDGKSAELSKNAYKPAYKKLTKNAYLDGQRLSAIGSDGVQEQCNISQNTGEANPLQSAKLGTKKEPMSSTDTGSKVNTPGRTRTCDLRIRNPLQNAVSPCKQRTPKSDWEETGQSQNSISPENPELAKLVKGWSKLSDDKKKAIIKMTS